MSGLSDIHAKIRRGDVLKITEAESVLKEWGYIGRSGKGSHRNWKHPTKPKILTLAAHGKDLPRYITRLLKKLMDEK